MRFSAGGKCSFSASGEQVSVSPLGETNGMDGLDEGFQDIELDIEGEECEAREPSAVRDPGAPTQAEVDKHNLTHMLFRAWCPACVAGKARDRPHRPADEDSKGIPQIVFDYMFMGAEGDQETLAIQVARDRRSRMIFAHVVPRKGMSHAHGAEELVKDVEKLAYKEIILKSDGEAALKSIQEEVRRRRAENTILENSPRGDSRANGAAERAVQAVGEQIRVLRKALESRVGLSLCSSHPVLAWLIEHAADVISKYQVGDDGKTAYERLKGKKFDKEIVEFGEKVHYWYEKKGGKENKLEVKWGEGFFLGLRWRTGVAIIGSNEGIVKAGTLRRVGAHRRWDGEGLSKIRGYPWKWNPESAEDSANVKIRWLTEEEKTGAAKVQEEELVRPTRMKLKKEEFVRYSFTEGCP